jgi:hypothetical protein
MVAIVLCYFALIAAGIHYGTGGTWVEVHTGYYSSNLLGGLPRVGFGFSLGVLLQQLTRDTLGARIRLLFEDCHIRPFCLTRRRW